MTFYHLNRPETKNGQKSLENFKKIIFKNLALIGAKSIEKFELMITTWFTQEKRQILEELKTNQDIQLKYVELLVKKLIKEKDDIKLLTKSLSLNNYNDFIIETILSSKSKKEEMDKRKENFDILKERDNEIRKKRERLLNEEKYKKYLKDLYKKNENIVDLNKPSCYISIRLFNGDVVKTKFNCDKKLRDIYSFVKKIKNNKIIDFILLDGFPPKPLLDFDKSIKDLGIENSVLVQKTDKI